MSPYVAMIGMVVLATLFVLVMIGLSVKVGPSRYNATKYDSFECGLQPTPQPAGSAKFSPKYYITAMLFIVFDIEIVFLYPWAAAFDNLTLFMVIEMVVFIVLVAASYFYVLRRGGLDWD